MPGKPSSQTGTGKKNSTSEALSKLYRYCAYQERSHQEVRNKLFELGLRQSEIDELIARLITEGFLNEERFAKAFAGGKFRLKKWGRLKIVNELEARGLTTNCIRAGLKEIEEEDYRKTLVDLLKKKSGQIVEQNQFIRRDKLSKYAIQKGFEPELVWNIIKRDF